MTDKKKLKPCPFCGARAEMNIVKNYKGDKYYNPRCTDSSCSGRTAKKWSNKDHAIWSWNRRFDDR